MPNSFIKFLLCGLVLAFLNSESAQAAARSTDAQRTAPARESAVAEKSAPGTQKVPTNITASRMEYDADGQTLLFTGDVHVQRPDFELWSDKMTVYLDKKEQGGDAADGLGGMEAGNVDHIVAEDNVRMKSKDKSGTSQKATYYAKTDKFVMEGSPVLKDANQSVVKGHTITHFFSTNRSTVSRPDIIFYAPDKSGDPFDAKGK